MISPSNGGKYSIPDLKGFINRTQTSRRRRIRDFQCGRMNNSFIYISIHFECVSATYMPYDPCVYMQRWDRFDQVHGPRATRSFYDSCNGIGN